VTNVIKCFVINHECVVGVVDHGVGGNDEIV
jgi:hypothetical protein